MSKCIKESSSRMRVSSELVLPQHVSPGVFAEILGCSVQTVRNRVDKNKDIPVLRTTGGHRRIDVKAASEKFNVQIPDVLTSFKNMLVRRVHGFLKKNKSIWCSPLIIEGEEKVEITDRTKKKIEFAMTSYMLAEIESRKRVHNPAFMTADISEKKLLLIDKAARSLTKLAVSLGVDPSVLITVFLNEAFPTRHKHTSFNFIMYKYQFCEETLFSNADLIETMRKTKPEDIGKVNSLIDAWNSLEEDDTMRIYYAEWKRSVENYNTLLMFPMEKLYVYSSEWTKMLRFYTKLREKRGELHIFGTPLDVMRQVVQIQWECLGNMKNMYRLHVGAIATDNAFDRLAQRFRIGKAPTTRALTISSNMLSFIFGKYTDAVRDGTIDSWLFKMTADEGEALRKLCAEQEKNATAYSMVAQGSFGTVAEARKSIDDTDASTMAVDMDNDTDGWDKAKAIREKMRKAEEQRLTGYIGVDPFA